MTTRRSKLDPTRRRGAYYTPEPIVRFLVDWAMAAGARRVLEPSAGDGRFVAALRRHEPEAVDAVEIDGESAELIRARQVPGVTVHQADAFCWYQPLFGDHRYDAVVGNPPFAGFHSYSGVSRGEGLALLRSEGIQASAMVNAWVPFVVLGCRSLRRGGRLAMVVPGELLHADYARPLRRYLGRRLTRMLIVTFRHLVFSGVTQEAVLLLGIAGGGTEEAAVSMIEVDGPEELAQVDPDAVGAATVGPGSVGSWSALSVPRYEQDLLQRITTELLAPLGQLGSIDVGIVTGANRFFCLPAADVERRGLAASSVVLAPRSVGGIALDHGRWRAAADGGEPCYLFRPRASSRGGLTAAELAYVEEGEGRGVHHGYKCSLRLPAWWRLPDPNPPEGFFARHVTEGPRMIVNTAEAVSVDSFMGVRPRPGVDVATVAASLHNSATFVIAELTWHAFGGGVLNVGPGLAEFLPVPQVAGDLEVREVDRLVGERDVDTTLRFVDERVLVSAGVDAGDAAKLRDLARALRARRLGQR